MPWLRTLWAQTTLSRSLVTVCRKLLCCLAKYSRSKPDPFSGAGFQGILLAPPSFQDKARQAHRRNAQWRPHLGGFCKR